MNDTLIIGGNGYVGSLLYSKINADSIDLCLYGKDLDYSQKINYNNADISSYKNIILLAGHSSVKMCEFNRKNAWVNNVDYFYNLCERLTPDQLLIYASSASVYGIKGNICKESNINLNPLNHYDFTKVTTDIIANKFISDGKNIIGLRFGTVNGYSKNIRSDLMINAMVHSYKTNGFIQSFNDWIKRPILGTEDLVEAIITILESKKVYSGQYNLCSFNLTVFEIANTVSKILGCELKRNENLSKEKVYDFEIDNSKFKNIYNFEFKQTIESIAQSLIDTDLKVFSNRNTDSFIFS
jgi:nucleoside-diphosphate-sugar epimerase